MNPLKEPYSTLVEQVYKHQQQQRVHGRVWTQDVEWCIPKGPEHPIIRYSGLG